MDPPQGPVAILWDIENCSIPSGVQPADVAINIRKALGGGAVTTFSAYGDFSSFPRTVREGCQRTGVKLIDVPNGRKDAADKAILVDMFLFALDNRPPSSIVLISGDVDFSHALHVLGQRGYTIILVIPSGVRVSPALCNAGQFVWDWPTVARGGGSISSTRPLTLPPRVGLNEVSSQLMGYQTSENQNVQKNEETFRHQRVSRNPYNNKDFSHASQSLSKNASGISLDLFCSPSAELSSGSIVSGLNKAISDPLANQDHASCLQKQSGDLNYVLERLVKLLRQSGGRLSVPQILPRYQKLFAQPLWVTEYGTSKLTDLLLKFSDVMSLEGEGAEQIVYLNNSQDCAPNDKLLHSPERRQDTKGIESITADAPLMSGSTDQLSHDNEIVLDNTSFEKKELMDSVPTDIAVGDVLGADCKMPTSCSNPTQGSKIPWPATYVLGYGAYKFGNFFQKLSGVRPLTKQDEGGTIQNVNVDAHLVSGLSDELSQDKSVEPKANLIEKGVRTVPQLKGQLVKLLESSGGCLALAKVLPEYQRFFDQPLHISDYGACKLINLLQQFSDVMSIEGEETKELIYLKNCRASNTIGIAPLSSLLKEMGGKENGIESVNADSHCVSPSIEECVVPQENSTEEEIKEQTMIHLKGQLVKLLEQYEGCLALAQIPSEYQKFFGQPFCASDYGSFKLMNLLQKFSDVMAIEGEDEKTSVYLRKFQASLNTDGKVKGVQNTNEDSVSRSSDYSKREAPEDDPIEKERQRINTIQVMPQLIKLLEQSGGSLAFNQISQEYQKLFGRQLCVSEYGACKLVDLLQKFSLLMTIEGEGPERLVYLKNYQVSTVNGTQLSSLSKDKEGSGKGIQNMHEDFHLVSGSPEDKRMVVEEHSIDEKRERKALFRVRGQLVKILAQSGGCLAFNKVAQEYDKLFGWKLCVSEYGALKLVDLLQKFPAEMTIEGEGSGRMVYLKNYQAGVANALPLNGKGTGSSDDKTVVLEDNPIDEKAQRKAMFRVRGQLMKLLEQFAGCLALVEISSEYQKFYGHPLRVSEFGACKLVDLLQKFSNVMKIEGEGLKRMVYLKNYRAGSANDKVPPSKVKKESAIPSAIENGHLEKISLETERKEKSFFQLKVQVVKLLKLSGGCVALAQFPLRYQQLFDRPLCISEFGACKLINLLQSFSDMISIEGKGPKKIVYLKNHCTGTTIDIPLVSSSSSENHNGIVSSSWSENHNGMCGITVCE